MCRSIRSPSVFIPRSSSDATAGSDEKCEACLALGAERAFNYRQTDFVAAAREATGGRGILLVEAMSAAWGTVPVSGGKQVWAEIALDQ